MDSGKLSSNSDLRSVFSNNRQIRSIPVHTIFDAQIYRSSLRNPKIEVRTVEQGRAEFERLMFDISMLMKDNYACFKSSRIILASQEG